MKRIIVGLVAFLMVFPNFVSAASVAELQKQINALLAQVALLQQQMTQQQEQQTTGGSCGTLYSDLQIESSGNEVSILHKFLQQQGFSVDNKEVASNSFGESTASAVVGFQTKYKSEVLTPAGLSRGTGYVGGRTRNKFNMLYGCGNAKPVPVSTTPIQTIPINQLIKNPSITILSPNGGETYQSGSTIGVTWKTTDVPSSFAFDLIRLRSYSDGKEYNITTNIINDGQETISLPSSVPTGSYTLEMKSYLNNVLVMDSSNSYFKIVNDISIISQPALYITTSSSLPVAKVGDQYQVVLNVSPDSMPTNQLSWSVTSGSLPTGLSLSASDFGMIITGAPTTAGTYKFNLTAKTSSQSSTRNFILTVNPVTTVASYVTVQIPNRGEQWQNGSKQTISWSDTGGTTSNTRYTVFITKADGGAYGIAGDVYGKTSFEWTVGQVMLGNQQITLSPGSSYYVQVVKQNVGAGVYDQSDKPFNIITPTTTTTTPTPTITILSPNGGESYVTNVSTIRITYKSTNIVGQQLTAYLYSPVWNNVRTYTGYANNSGYIDMDLVKASGPEAGQYKINLCAQNVSSPTDSAKPLCDSSDNFFSITSEASVSPTNGTLSFSQNSFNFNYTKDGPVPPPQFLTFTNTSNVNITFTLKESYTSGWLSTSYATVPLTATPGTPTGLGASVDPIKLQTPGTYHTNIVVTGNFTGSPLSIPVNLTVADAPVVNPTATLTAGNANSAQSQTLTAKVGETINYKWNSTNASSAYSSYNVYPAYTSTNNCGGLIGGGPFTWVANSLSGSTSATVESCQAGRDYFIKYTAVNSNARGGLSTDTVLTIHIPSTTTSLNTSSDLNQMANVLMSASAVLENMLKSLR